MSATFPTLPRTPHILDPVLVWGERGSIALLRAGYAHIERDDDVRVQVGVDRLRWDPLGSVWLILRDGDGPDAEPPEPRWLHEDPAFFDPADGSPDPVPDAIDQYKADLDRGLGYHDTQARP